MYSLDTPEDFVEITAHLYDIASITTTPQPSYFDGSIKISEFIKYFFKFIFIQNL